MITRKMIYTITSAFVVLLLTIGLLLQSGYLTQSTRRPPWRERDTDTTDNDPYFIPSPNTTSRDGKPKLSFKDQSYRRVLTACKKRIRKCEAKLSQENNVYIGHIRRNAGSEDPGINGQVEQGKPLCNALIDLVKQEDVKLILELGTWEGGGSTLCIANGINELAGKLLYTLELNEANWDTARRALKSYPTRCILGTTVGPASYLTPDSIPPSYKDEHYTNYYQAELEAAAYLEPMLKPLCEAHAFDVVVHDGGEYTTTAEWDILKNHCKPKYLVFRGRHNVSLKSKVLTEKIEGTCYKAMTSGWDPSLQGDIPWWIYKCE